MWNGKQTAEQKTFQANLKFAHQGNAVAQAYVGCAYDQGRGVAQSDSKAVEWYQKAAVQGHADAQYNLGVMYRVGQGVAQSDTQAVGWWQKAAVQGVAGAQYNLGWMYDQGQGVAQSDSQAMEWYQKAAAQGNANAQANLKILKEKQAQQMLERLSGQTPEQKTFQANLKLAHQGNPQAQAYVGAAYSQGLGVAQSDTQAVEWWQKAAVQGIADAQYNLGWMYQNGRGVAQSDSKAVASQILRKSYKNRNGFILDVIRLLRHKIVQMVRGFWNRHVGHFSTFCKVQCLLMLF